MFCFIYWSSDSISSASVPGEAMKMISKPFNALSTLFCSEQDQ
jgi:hypothetical protein